MSKTVFDCCLQEEIPFELLDIASHPTPSDLEKRLGKDLVEVFLKTCKPIEKILFGRDKPLKGPEGKLWINPEDRLGDMKVKITKVPQSPSTSYTDCLQALTHHGILEIGKKYEEKMAEMNRRAMEDAVRESEELSKFEAGLRIKFHVETETKKLNEEWLKRLQELMKIHEEEKNDMVKIFQEARTVFCEFIAKKCKEETDKLVEKAKADTREAMKGECAKIIDDELANQQKIFEESMEMTLNNLKANDRDRMDELRNQCLKAMDVQHHLMMCRQITELLNLMSIEKRHYDAKLSEMRDKYEKTISSLQSQLPSSLLTGEHQSKSIFVATLEKVLERFALNRLDEHEQRIFDEIHRIMANNDCDSKIFIVTEASSSAAENSLSIIDENDWINRREDERSLQRASTSVAVQWERQDLSVFNDDTFMSSIFNRMSTDVDRPSSRATEKIASSIIAMVRESNDDKLLEESITKILHNMVTKQCRVLPAESVIQPVIPMPVLREEPLQIKDSIELINEKRISIISDNKCEGHSFLLGAIDSREILSRRTSSIQPVFEDRNSPPSHQSLVSIESQESSDSNKDNNGVPPYMKIPPYRCRNFIKMSDEDWMQLARNEVDELRESRRRVSSIQLEAPPQRLSSRQGSRRSSILKWPSMDAQAGSVVLNDALQPIREKCLEAAAGIKVESILRTLCEDNDTEHQMSSTGCSARGQN